MAESDRTTTRRAEERAIPRRRWLAILVYFVWLAILVYFVNEDVAGCTSSSTLLELLQVS